MKSARLSISQEYLRFTIEADGESLTEELEKTFSDILEGDLSGDGAVASYIRSEHLDSGTDDNITDDVFVLVEGVHDVGFHIDFMLGLCLKSKGSPNKPPGQQTTDYGKEFHVSRQYLTICSRLARQ